MWETLLIVYGNLALSAHNSGQLVMERGGCLDNDNKAIHKHTIPQQGILIHTARTQRCCVVGLYETFKMCDRSLSNGPALA